MGNPVDLPSDSSMHTRSPSTQHRTAAIGAWTSLFMEFSVSNDQFLAMFLDQSKDHANFCRIETNVSGYRNGLQPKL